MNIKSTFESFNLNVAKLIINKLYCLYCSSFKINHDSREMKNVDEFITKIEQFRVYLREKLV